MDPPTQKHSRVVIVGGSLAGLMCAIVLKKAGYHVQVLEQDDDQRRSHMAGIGLGPVGARFLSQYARLESVFTHTTNGVHLLKGDGSMKLLAQGRREITSWDTLYLCFPPHPADDTGGTATYSSNTKVIKIESSGASGSGLVVFAQDTTTKKEYCIPAAMIIGADGPDSVVRARYLPEVRRHYAGYVAWRGTIPENEVSADTFKMFESSVVAHTMKKQHCIVYSIPGADGSLEPGRRFLNFLWYTNESPEALEDILVDNEGRRRHNIVPATYVREEVWAARLEEARSMCLPKAVLEVMGMIRHPFIQVITDFCSPCAMFEGGKALLVGDAVSLFRPHAAMGGAQAAYHALLLEQYLCGEISLEGWHDRVTQFSYSFWLQSVWWGEFYQGTFRTALLSGLRYWLHCGRRWLAQLWARKAADV
ncbi:hypothetical protein B0I35DRAFT_445782 [Stachybotrys elegans]|uniref:FAD-binding domain-containing protein n=1 Tax=Stachybotrys elegans TaxID=80388 RepID=A0A8K0SCR9_9HYPO|nr:hypothetical protein B0I35DRAFT_445782 [Stachybotrys elegans]